MEVDGMYENTPWERLSLWAPWIGVGVIVLAIVLYYTIGRRDSARGDGMRIAARSLGALGASFATLGALFTIMWRPAHDVYPHAFGRAAIGVGVGSVIVGALIALVKRQWMYEAIQFATLTASACAAAAIAAFSHSIIAEGQVTAMVLPVGFVAAALVAALVALVKTDDAVMHETINVLAFLAAGLFFAYKLPVVQFKDDTNIFPVTGGFYIASLGRLARMALLPFWTMLVVGAATIAMGYLLGWSYGIAIGAVGLSISGPWGRLRPPSEEFLPPY